MWTLASRRWPTMPMASRMLSCASSKNSCGRTCRTSRSSGKLHAAGGFDGAAHVVALHVARPRADGDAAAAIDAAHVAAGDADQRGFDRHADDALRLLRRRGEWS